MTSLAEAALAVLAKEGDETDAGWHFATKMSDGLELAIDCTGSDLPSSVPSETAFPADIPKEPDWQGTYRLKVAAPLVAFDISWQEDVPLRIMMFSRGDWETELLNIAEL